jgi:putative ABC transport system ATP-binding protein
MSRSAVIDPIIPSLVQRLGLDRLLRRMPRELSIGERQRVSFVRALARRPTILLADEPTAALDPVLAEELFSLIIEVAAEQCIATLVVTHEWDLVERFHLRRLTGVPTGAGRVVFHA